MWNMKICDDDIIYMEFIQRQIQHFAASNNLLVATECYPSAAELAAHIDLSQTVYFLDIDMPQMNGLEVAKKIVDMNRDNIIVFVSSHEEFVFEAIHYQPFRFIRKSRLAEDLEEAMNSLCHVLTQQSDMILVPSKEGVRNLILKNLHYIESNKHYLLFYYKEEIIEARGKISDYSKKLERYSFVQPGISYLINCDYIEKFRTTEVTLLNHTVIPIGRKWKEQAEKIYMDYVRRMGNVGC